MRLSIIVPLFNEEDNICPLLHRLHQALANYSYEIILVDDGSNDNTAAVAQEWVDERTVHLVQLRRNYGQTTALKAGIAAARGTYIVTIDGDLQNDPDDIPLMLEKIASEDYDMIAGYREKRKDAFLHRKLPSRIANKLIGWTTGIHLHDYGCTLKIFKASLAKELELHGELHRFIPVLAYLQGARIAEMPVGHHPRIHGQSKYGMGRSLKVVSDLILMLFFQKYWTKAMHLFGSMGILLFGVGAACLGYLLILKLQGIDIGDRPLLMLGILAILGGMQFISFGLIAEMLYRIHNRSEAKNYAVREVSRKVSRPPVSLIK